MFATRSIPRLTWPLLSTASRLARLEANAGAPVSPRISPPRALLLRRLRASLMDASVAVVLLTELLGAKRRWCSWSFAVFSRGKGSEPDMVVFVAVFVDVCFSG